MLRKILKKSKWVHKWFGLLLILFLIWISLSGILLNHPAWIAGYSVPQWLVPPQYVPDNWNRSTLLDLVASEKDSLVLYAAGKQGVWRSQDGGRSFSRFETGFEQSDFYKKTKDLWLSEEGKTVLLAATDGGLLVNDLVSGTWAPVALGRQREAVRKILQMDQHLLVITESSAYRSTGTFPDFKFRRVNWRRDEPHKRVTLIDLFFHLHDGRVWGLPGRLLFDLAGLILIFLSLSAFYIWYFPSRSRRWKARGVVGQKKKNPALYRWLNKYHAKLGIWLALLLFIIGGTGFFMRPPVLALIAEGSVPAKAYPGPLPVNPWDKKILNALYDPVEDKLIVNATDGNWAGPSDFSQPFQKIELNVPLFVMGATVFEPYGSGGYLIGSFNGLYHLERETGQPFDWIAGKYVHTWSNVRPADLMVTGYFKVPGLGEFITTHEQGIVPLPVNSHRASEQGNRNGKLLLNMPAELKSEYRMPLWNFMFELHNGRIFKDWLGGYYILLVPLGSLLFVMIVLSGVYDWLVLWYLKRKIQNERTS